MTSTDKILNAALESVDRGFSVIPVHPITKKPYVPWKKYQSRLPTEEELEEWWRTWPNANIAIITGSISGIWVVDADGPAGIQWMNENLPRTGVYAVTGKGIHAYFLIPAGVTIKNAVRLAPEVDVRGEGGYVVVPPSVHASGHQYEWKFIMDGWDDLTTLDIADVLAKIKDKKKCGNLNIDLSGLSTQVSDDPVAKGERNNAMTQLVGHYIANGHGDRQVEALIVDWNKDNQPPLGLSEIQRTIKSIRGIDDSKKQLQEGGGGGPPTARSISEILGEYVVSDEYVNGLGAEEWLFDNLMIRNHILTVIAKSGGGKTTFFFYYVSRILSQKGYTVWYIDADSPPSDHKKMKRFADKFGLNFLIPDLNVGKSVETLIKDLTSGAANQADLKSCVIILDTLKKFADLMIKQKLKNFFILLRKLTKLGATVVLLAHANKYPDSDGNMIFEGCGDVRSDSDELIFFYHDKCPSGGINVTTSVDPGRNAKVRGIFESFSFHIDQAREVTILDKVFMPIDLSGVSKMKATDEDILMAAEEYLKLRKEPVPQSTLVQQVVDTVDAGTKKVRGVIVRASTMKGENLKLGAKFVYTVGKRNAHFYELPSEEEKQCMLWKE